ncbi:MAG: hypothetical protein KDB79_17110 [Acidobacteria bacterium]|nr:hypothetical protein [Acidobacteriota bacterium]
MEIKRKMNMEVSTSRLFTIRYSQNVEQIECAECESKMLAVEQVAVLFGVKQRLLFQIIEQDRVHFIETVRGSVMVCLSSLSAALDQDRSILEPGV